MNLLKKIWISTEIVHHLMNKKNVLIDLLKKKSYEVNNSKEKINPNNLVYEWRKNPKRS